MMYSWLHEYTTILAEGRCTLKPVLDESLPIYQQIADMIMDDIIDGQLKEDEKIPSENEIAQFFSINRATIRKGLQVLLDLDFLYKKRGIGMFVKKERGRSKQTDGTGNGSIRLFWLVNY